MEIKFTEEEKNFFQGNRELLTDYINARAVLEEVKGYNFEENEKMELKYITNTEKMKFFMTKKIEDKIDIKQEDVVRVYTENKKSFDDQKIQFSEAKKIIGNSILNQQVSHFESMEMEKIINELDEEIKFSKEEIKFSNGNGDVLNLMVINKVLLRAFEKENFKEIYKVELDNIEKNVLANFYLDLQVRKKVNVTHGEVEDFYKNNGKEFENIPQNEAYNIIATDLLQNKMLKERERLVSEISKKYNVEELVKENL